MTDSTQPLRVTYDDEADAAYIYFIPDIEAGGVSRTVPVDGGERPVDSEPRRRRRRSLIGLEVLDATRRLPAALLANRA